jgi:peroxidase
MMPV